MSGITDTGGIGEDFLSRYLSHDRLLELVDRLYDGALDPQAWPNIVERLSSFFGSTKARLFTGAVPPSKGGLGISHGIADSLLQVWADRYIDHDVWLQAAAAKDLIREGNANLDPDLMPEDQFVRSVIYREHLEQVGVARLCSGVIFDGRASGLLPTLMVTYRSIAEPRYTEGDREMMRLLIPHFSRALGVMFRLRDAELRVAASLAALDRLQVGVVLLDSQGIVSHLNASAQRTVEARDGLTLEVYGRRERLSATDPQTAAAIEHALALATCTDVIEVPHFSSTVVVQRAAAHAPLVLQFAPLPTENEFSLPGRHVNGIVFVLDAEQPLRIDAKLLRELYGITAAEARVALLVCSGRTLADAARELGIGHETVKTHVEQLFAKTGTVRQSDLVRLLIGLASHNA